MSGHHIRLDAQHLAGNGGLGRYVLVPGDPARAARIAERFERRTRVEGGRNLTAHLGTLGNGAEAVDVLAMPTGIGASSAEVVLHELIAAGARRLVRVGSCGALQPEISPGQVVIAYAAVRDERASADYAPLEYPACSHPQAVAAMVAGAHAAGHAGETFLGVCHSKATLYAREFGHGPAGERNLDYDRWLRRCGVLVSEMEASMLFVMAAVHAAPARPLATPGAAPCRAACVLAVFGSDQSQMALDQAQVDLAERRAIEVALAGVAAWARADRAAAT